jgi:hypothetical protein
MFQRDATRAPFRRLPAHVTLRLRPDLPSLRTVAIVRDGRRELPGSEVRGTTRRCSTSA